MARTGAERFGPGATGTIEGGPEANGALPVRPRSASVNGAPLRRHDGSRPRWLHRID
jgi:hypothetical protein